MRDSRGHDVTTKAVVTLTKPIEMERLFAGYALALAGQPVPCDLAIGAQGVVIEIELDDEPMALVEFLRSGTPFWRGLLRADEFAKV